MDVVQNLLESLLQQIRNGQIQHLGVWVYFLLAALVTIEGSVVTVLGGVAAGAGLLNPYMVAAAAIGGNTASDLFWYRMGTVGRVDWLMQHRLISGLNQEDLDRLRGKIYRHAPRLLLISKLTAGFAIACLVATGTARVPVRRWIGPVFLAECTRTCLVVAMGYHLTNAVARIEQGMIYLVVIGVLGFAFYALWYMRCKSSSWWVGKE